MYRNWVSEIVICSKYDRYIIQLIFLYTQIVYTCTLLTQYFKCNIADYLNIYSYKNVVFLQTILYFLHFTIVLSHIQVASGVQT